MTSDGTTWTSAAPGGITGTGTQNYLPKYNNVGGTTLGNSSIFDNGTSVGINTASPGSTFKLDVNGAANFRDDVLISGFKVGLGGGSISSNLAIGVGAINATNTSGGDNIAIGGYALEKVIGGSNNIAIGGLSLNAHVSNHYNTAVGYRSLTANTSGSQNTGIGKDALGLNTTGSNNTAIGFDANVSANNLNNATAIGYGSRVTADNTIQLGNGSVTSVNTSGALTTGAAGTAVTYPRTHGTSGQVLSLSLIHI